MLAMALSHDEIRHVATLARLGLAPGDVERLGAELSTILDHVSTISQLDLADVPPTSHPLDVVNALRDDRAYDPYPAITREQALQNAPDPGPDGFRVPPIGA